MPRSKEKPPEWRELEICQKFTEPRAITSARPSIKYTTIFESGKASTGGRSFQNVEIIGSCWVFFSPLKCWKSAVISNNSIHFYHSACNFERKLRQPWHINQWQMPLLPRSARANSQSATKYSVKTVSAAVYSIPVLILGNCVWGGLGACLRCLGGGGGPIPYCDESAEHERREVSEA